MARDETEPEYLFGYYVVCFLDVMGQGDAIKRLETLPLNASHEPAYIEAARQSLGLTLQMRKAIRAYFQARRPPSTLGILNHDLDQWERHRRVDVRIQKFADTVIAYAPLKAGDGTVSCIPVHQMLGACATAMAVAVVTNACVRGGIEVAPAVEVEDSDIYGPALAKAYDLERKVAIWPRVVVGDGLRQFLREVEKCKGDSRIARVERRIATNCASLFCRDVDDHWALDWLGYSALDMLGTVAPDYIKHVKSAIPWIRERRDHFTSTDDPHKAKKYERLEAYLISRLGGEHTGPRRPRSR